MNGAVLAHNPEDLLLGVRDDLRQGALRFRLDEQGPFLATEESGVPALTDLPVLLDIAARAERDTASYEDLKRLVRAGSSLGGARPKAHVLDATGRVAIAKFPSDSSDTWNVMAWERVALDLARDAGVTVPDSRLIRIGDRNVLVVDRFDRRGTARIGYASAMTMLEASDGDQRSYLEIAEVIEQRSTAATAELRQLWPERGRRTGLRTGRWCCSKVGRGPGYRPGYSRARPAALRRDGGDQDQPPRR